MYLEYYGLKEKPFSLTPDPAFLFRSNAHRKAIAFLKYGLEESKGFLQLTGPVGSGKTTLLRTILAQLDEGTKTAYIINPRASFSDLLRSIMKDLEIPNIPETTSKIKLLDFFHDYLLAQMKKSQAVIVIIDEAQNLSLQNLEEIRMLSNFETTKQKLIQIVFVGQPELLKTLDSPQLRQLKQRIQVRYHLAPLKPSEIKGYIKHRLHVAGADNSIVFSDDACASIYEYSKGIPRLINSVCDVMLLVGFVNNQKKFTAETVKEALREMSGSFDDETSENEEEQEVSMLREKDASALHMPEIDNTKEPIEDVLLSMDGTQEDIPHDPSEPGSGSILSNKDAPSDYYIFPTGKITSVAEIVIEPGISMAVPSDELPSSDLTSANAADQLEPCETDITEPVADNPISELNDKHPASVPFKGRSVFFHSYLRHSGKREFHTTGFYLPRTTKSELRIHVGAEKSPGKLMPRGKDRFALYKHPNTDNGIFGALKRFIKARHKNGERDTATEEKD